MKLFYETGTIQELGETTGYPHGRFYSYVDLRREDGSVAKLHDVLVSQDVSPKIFKTDEAATFAFIKQKGQLLDKPLMFGGRPIKGGCVYRYLMLGYAGNDVYGVERDPGNWLLNIGMAVSLVVLAAMYYVVYHGWWYGLLAPLALILLFSGQAWLHVSSMKRQLNKTAEKFSQMGFKSGIAVTYD